MVCWTVNERPSSCPTPPTRSWYASRTQFPCVTVGVSVASIFGWPHRWQSNSALMMVCASMFTLNHCGAYVDQIGCDNDDCEHGEWFHYTCVGLEKVVSRCRVRWGRLCNGAVLWCASPHVGGGAAFLVGKKYCGRSILRLFVSSDTNVCFTMSWARMPMAYEFMPAGNFRRQHHTQEVRTPQIGTILARTASTEHASVLQYPRFVGRNTAMPRVGCMSIVIGIVVLFRPRAAIPFSAILCRFRSRRFFLPYAK